jgi:4-hydroxybenzoate polyprenyltransferase
MSTTTTTTKPIALPVAVPAETLEPRLPVPPGAATASAETADPATSPLAAVATFGRMIKFSHTVFALPFALAAAAIAARGHGVTIGRLAAILVAMVGARTAAMGFNRIVDRHFDARNPRTAGRELPAGKVSLAAAVALTAASAALFVGAAASLGPLCLALSPVALALVLGYSYTKRFTWLCHLFLGLAIAAGPGGAWIAVRGDVAAPALWLMAAVATWIGGFDILYALADRDFDRQAGLQSIPARFGVPTALTASALLHLVTLTALLMLARSAHLGPIYLAGVALIAAILVWEHAIVRPGDLSRLDMAFFNLNGYVSVAFFGAVLGDVLVH